MNIERRKLKDVDKSLIIKLLNHPLVKRHMPLSTAHFGEEQYTAFMKAKASIWERFGFGPWAYFIDNQFVGWGGIQPDEDNFELALVLCPKAWGYGRYLYQDLIQEAFVELCLKSVTILFPPSRTRIRWILKAGFIKEDEVSVNGEHFIRFRLHNPEIHND